MRNTFIALLAACVLGGCSGMSLRDRDTAAGAIIGGALGNILTDGSALGTVGGAAVGGVVGNQVNHRRR